MSESKATCVEIRDVDGQTLRKLVDYIYTAEVEVTEDNVQVGLITSSFLNNIYNMSTCVCTCGVQLCLFRLPVFFFFVTCIGMCLCFLSLTSSAGSL